MSQEKSPYLDVIAAVKIDDSKSKWTKIGVAFPLKNRPGFSVKLEFIPVPQATSYEFIIVEPSERKDETID